MLSFVCINKPFKDTKLKVSKDMNGKKQIIERFLNNVKGQSFNKQGYSIGHDGAEGHWLERQMGITPNGLNKADIFGFEMKKDSVSKTTFGDWSPDLTIWGRKKPLQIPEVSVTREQFLHCFGKPNPLKSNRFSWSGEPIPNIDKYNRFGQIMEVNTNSDIVIKYSFLKDCRINKNEIMPDHLKRNLILARWQSGILKTKLERKFNDKGWFKCYKNQFGVYTHIGFGDPINFTTWIQLVKQGIVFFDSGMYEGNPRPYSQWRANNNYWDNLITDTYK